MTDEKRLKGGAFDNRYRLTGTLKTLSPLHIGTGEHTDTVYTEAAREELEKEFKDKGGIPLVSTVMKDANGKPLIPGSSLRGVIRHWLLNVLGGVDNGIWAATRNYEDQTLTNLSQPEQINKVMDDFSWLELLFGTPFHAGKVEIWDATCKMERLSIDDTLLHWNLASLTYFDTSVAIDPETGTALDKLLYKTEVVPPGIEFEFNLVGQNLSDIELGLVFLALEGFNSKIYPIRVGARGGRGYGRLQFSPGPMYELQANEVKDWIKSMLDASDGTTDNGQPATKDQQAAGYFALPEIDEATRQARISNVKAKLQEALDGQ